MRITALQFAKALRITLLLFLLVSIGIIKGYAYYDFSSICPTGQTLYYTIIDAENHYLEISCPRDPSSPFYCWQGFSKPSGNIVFPENIEYLGTYYTVTSIGNFAFYQCVDLIGNLNIPNTITSIGHSAFEGCNGFTGGITIGSSIMDIGFSAFSDCNNISGSLILPNTLKTIGSKAFFDCYGLYGCLNIPSSVTEIGESAFQGCNGLNPITIPPSIDFIVNSSFYETGWWNNQPDGIVYLDGYCLGYKGSKPTGDLQIAEGTRIIAHSAFSSCTELTGILTIPNSVTTIGYYAFLNCGFTGDLIIPNSIKNIGTCAFAWCTGFTGSLTIGNSVTTIGGWSILWL